MQDFEFFLLNDQVHWQVCQHRYKYKYTADDESRKIRLNLIYAKIIK
jgi:hypothetical protein